MWKLELFKASWTDSIQLLHGPSLKLLILVSTRMFLLLYAALLNAWPLLLYALLPLVGMFVGANSHTVYMIYLCQLYVAHVISLNLLYYIALVGSARPSVEYKDAWYWLTQPVLLCWAVFYLIYTVLMMYSTSFFEWELANLVNWPVLIWLMYGEANFYRAHSLVSLIDFSTYVSAFLFVMWLLFLYDGKKTIFWPVQSAYRGALMLAYNLPIFAVISGIFLLFIKILAFSEAYAIPVIPYYRQLENSFLLMILIPFWICFLTTIYIKRLHEQGGIYYSK